MYSPLSGIRIIELAGIGPAVRRDDVADCDATVIRVERVDRPLPG